MVKRIERSMRLLGLLLVGCWSTVLVGDVRGQGGSLAGKVSDAACGEGVKRVTVRAFAHGRSMAIGALSEGDGSYVFADLPAGAYAICIPAGEKHKPLSVAVQVADGAATTLNLKLCQSLVIDGDSWLQAHRSFEQSFVATGLGLTMVGVKAFGPDRQVQVQLREGDDPRGKVVGPMRTIDRVGGEGSACVWWSGSEARTVPHGRYTLKMAAPEGQKWVSGVAGRGDVYASGSAYFDGWPRPHSDLGIAVCEDNDDLRTNYALAGSRRTYRATSAGQRFVALSKNITFASAMLAGGQGRPIYVRFSIHEDGPGGRQVGPSKGVGVSEDAAVAWCPAEVPVVPGRVYYLHIESFDGGKFLTAVQPDSYADGHAVFDGRCVEGRDICAMVAGQITDEDFRSLVSHPRSEEMIPLHHPSFEDSLKGWNRLGESGAVVGCDEGVVPPWGAKMFGWTNKGQGEGSRTTLCQQIEVTPNQRYSFSGSVYTDHRGGRSSDVKVRLVVLPAGGDAVRDNDQIKTSQWYATEGQWRRGSVEFEAGAETISVGFDLEQRFSLESSSLYVDGAHLERIGAR